MSYTELGTEPRRRFLPSEAPVDLDSLGFLSQATASNALKVSDLYSLPAVLIVAPPWTGKTFVARQLQHHLSRSPHDVFQWSHATLFERFGRSETILPNWWLEWKESDLRACWIIDAIDEDDRSSDKHTHTILSQLEQLNRDNRRRLCLLLFCRENEVPAEVEDRLGELYSEHAFPQHTGGLPKLRLAPLDCKAARDLVNDSEPEEDTFPQICSIISENKLQAVASLPVVLQHLAGRPGANNESLVDVWRGVLSNLLRDLRRERNNPEALTPIADRFAATERIAVILTFTEHAEVSSVDAHVNHLTIHDAFSRENPQNESLRRAAHDATKSAVFRRTPTGYTFAQRHVREWFTAFALAAVPLARLRPLVADADGKPFATLRSPLGVLDKVTSQQEVREWLAQTHGGIPPRSDAAPWTADQAIAALDRFQSLARQSEGLPRYWLADDLRDLYAPGLDAELQKRLSQPDLKLAEQKLLLGVARATKATLVVPTLSRLLHAPDGESQGRESAAYCLANLASNDQITDLASIAMADCPSHSHEIVAAILIRELYRRTLWAFSRAAQYAPMPNRAVHDATTMLFHELKRCMSINDARGILETTDWSGFTHRSARQTTRPTSDLV